MSYIFDGNQQVKRMQMALDEATARQEYAPIDYGRLNTGLELGELINPSNPTPYISYGDILGQVNQGIDYSKGIADFDAEQAIEAAKYQPLNSLPQIQYNATTPPPAKGKVYDINRPDIQGKIIAKARQYGLNPSDALAIAYIESKFNPLAGSSKSSAKGVFQFIDSTGRAYGLNSQTVYNPDMNIDAGMRYMRDNIADFRKEFRRNPSVGEIYMMHQQGSGGLSKLLRNPNAPAASIIGKDKLLKNGGRLNQTAGDFMNMWSDKASAASQFYGNKFRL